RSGKLFAYQWSNIKPDILSSAKGLGGGFPVGACLANYKCSAAMVAGTHGSTFGGNPVAMAAANAVLDVILEDGFLEHVVEMGAVLRNGLEATAAKHADKIIDVRGLGLLMGIEISEDIVNGNVVKALEAQGLLTVGAGSNVIRFIPPLIVEESHITDALATLDDVLTGIDA
ncbi:MAG: aminotransferase class III-fold pyridoxal phosphate-dependent enzyme, partial [Rhodospirillales bacterium]|nr:aminotransferase class III-fold pyridoxal phosphate-dependent enzyme [Rhodospirillales bacterium]